MGYYGRSHIRAIKTTYDGITFDSKAEFHRYAQLKALESAGLIKDLVLQPRFDLIVNGVKVARYTADFEYSEGLSRIVEEVKGHATPLNRLRYKLFKALYPHKEHRIIQC